MENVIKLTGRIDSNNSTEIEEKINKEVDKFLPNDEIVLDASNLEYISSAGLRIILRLKKRNDTTKVINCNSEIYDIFDMTGFSQMMEVSKKMREISVDGCEVIGDGFYGTVYRIDPETIVKVFKFPDSINDIKREQGLAKKAFVMGIPTAIPYDIVKIGNLYGSVFELLDAESIAKSINKGENIDDFAKNSVEILKKMHSTKVDPNELPSRKEQVIKLAKYCEDFLPPDTADKLIKLLETIPETYTMLHCDFHIKNIMRQNGELLLIDMDTLSFGHPIFEFGGMYATYQGFSCVNKNNPKEFLGISYENSTHIWDSTFRQYYCDKSEEELKDIQKKISIISYLQILYLREKFNNPGYNVFQEEIDFCKKYLEENVKDLDTLEY